jgi:hypothetical protein
MNVTCPAFGSEVRERMTVAVSFTVPVLRTVEDELVTSVLVGILSAAEAASGVLNNTTDASVPTANSIRRIRRLSRRVPDTGTKVPPPSRHQPPGPAKICVA